MSTLKKIFFFTLFIFLFGCVDKKDFDLNDLKDLNFSINGRVVSFPKSAVSSNENCDMIFISIDFIDKGRIGHRIDLNLTKHGDLKEVFYAVTDYASNNDFNRSKTKTYLSLNFYPVSTFGITNFSYNYDLGKLSFDFEGRLFEEFNYADFTELSGSISLQNIEKNPCSFIPHRLEYRSENFNFISIDSHTIGFSNGLQNHWFSSNNGYRILFTTSHDLWNSQLGQIYFDETTQADYVKLKKYIGPFLADQRKVINSDEWYTYESTGIIIIEKLYIENKRKVMEGRIDFVAKSNDLVIHEVRGMKFRITDH